MAKSILNSIESVAGIRNVTEKQVGTLVDQAVRNYTKAKRNLHVAACVGLHYAAVFGDTRPLKRLLVGMGTRSQLRHNIAAWVRESAHIPADERENGKVYQQISAKIDKDGNVDVRVCKDADLRKAVDIQHAWDNPFYEMEPTNVKAPVEMTVEQLLAYVQKVVDGDKAATPEAIARAEKMLAA